MRCVVGCNSVLAWAPVTGSVGAVEVAAAQYAALLLPTGCGPPQNINIHQPAVTGTRFGAG